MIEFSKCRNFSRYFTNREFHHRRSSSIFKNFRKTQQETFAVEPPFSLATPDMKFYSSQHKKRKMLQKSLENFQRNIYDGVCSIKVASLQCNRLQLYYAQISPHIFFQKMSGKLAEYCREKFMMYQCSNWFVRAEHFWRNLKNSDVFTGKPT